MLTLFWGLSVRRSLLKKSTGIHIELADESWHNLESTDAEISTSGDRVTLHLNLSKNFRVRNKQSHQYSDALSLSETISEVKHFQLESHGPIMDGLLHEMSKISKSGNTPQAFVCISLGAFGNHSFAVTPNNDDINLYLSVNDGSYAPTETARLS